MKKTKQKKQHTTKTFIATVVRLHCVPLYSVSFRPWTSFCSISNNSLFGCEASVISYTTNSLLDKQ